MPTDPVAALVDDVALTLSDYPDDTREAALAVYDEMITLLLLGRGLDAEDAARAAAGVARQVRERLAGMRGAGRA
ncbi:hypothetical protein [Azospirillum sp.]|uniref:hypothetical protein n=1 Tax=Azospirillum sp. TaxID=34012 RepID=UPI002D239BA2|nr:hypothetical protein [Azospirillum sp.]HYD64643.1 hypothetical protein [Azospirillum sp.]